MLKQWHRNEINPFAFAELVFSIHSLWTPEYLQYTFFSFICTCHFSLSLSRNPHHVSLCACADDVWEESQHIYLRKWNNFRCVFFFSLQKLVERTWANAGDGRCGAQGYFRFIYLPFRVSLDAVDSTDDNSDFHIILAHIQPRNCGYFLFLHLERHFTVQRFHSLS